MVQSQAANRFLTCAIQGARSGFALTSRLWSASFCYKLLLSSGAASFCQLNRPPKLLPHPHFCKSPFFKSRSDDIKCLRRSSAEDVLLRRILGLAGARFPPVSAPVTQSLRPLAGPIRSPSPWLRLSLCLSSCVCLPYANTDAMKSFHATVRKSAALFLKDVVCCNRLCHC
jgi:hypothetical protein